MKKQRIAIDVDGVLANFYHGAIERAISLGFGSEFPSHWTEVKSWEISPRFAEVMKDAWTDKEFWLNLPVLSELPFEPIAYITSRPVPSEVTAEWLEKNGFPRAEVITVKRPEDKLEHLKRLKPTVFIDDLHSTVRQCREAGINALLMKASYQESIADQCCDLPTIESLSEVKEYA